MKKYKKHGAGIALWLICMLLLFSGTSMAGQEETKQEETKQETKQEHEGRMEQVYINLPEIDVYTDGLSSSGGEITAYLGEEKLTLGQVVNFRDSGQGIYYFVLLDISDSIPDGYFNQIKEGILEFHRGMEEKDRLFLYTFGVEVRRVLDGTQSDEEAREMIDGLRNRDRKTSLYEAVHMAAKDAKQIPASVCKRRVLAVISDGEDVAVGKKTGAEALKMLEDSGLPVYAFGIRDTKREHLNQFGELSRMSGGVLTIFGQEDAREILTNLRERLKGGVMLRLMAKSNMASNRWEHFTLNYAGGEEYSREVLCSRWIEDRTAPEVTQIRQDGAKYLHLTFSEPVNGAGDPQSYRIVRIKRVGAKDADSALELIEKVKDGPSFEEIPVAVAGVSREDDRNYLLTLTENLTVGEYRIECPGITDRSMEQNTLKVPGRLQVLTEIPDEAVHKTWIERLKAAFDNWTWRLLLIAACAALFGLSVYLYRIRKSLKSAAASGGTADLPGKQVPGEFGAEQADGFGEPGDGLKIHLTDQEGNEYQEVIKKERCILGGRGNICDLHFDDRSMSRRHFSLEWDGEVLWLSDLKTTNGTQVNGGLLDERRALKNGDVITAGSTFLTVRW